MKKNALSLLLVCFMSIVFVPTISAQVHKSDDIIGTWLNQEATGKIQIFKQNGKYFGKLVWLRTPLDSITGQPRTDKENPDVKMKSAPLIGLVNLKNFAFDGTQEWSNGTIYDPKNGKTYSCKISFENANKLKIRGFIGLSLLGRNTLWTKSTPPAQ